MQVTKFNLVTDLQIMLSNVTHSNFYFECNTERGSIDQLYIELGFQSSNWLKSGIIYKPSRLHSSSMSHLANTGFGFFMRSQFLEWYW